MINFAEKINKIFKEFENIGKNQDGQGYTRLSYTDAEDQMHNKLICLAKRFDLQVEVDEVGNTFIYDKEYPSYDLIGSHLDSVTNGGQYDGVLGVLLGLLTLVYFKDQGIDIPLKVAALRGEESSNFMVSMLGSKLITGQLDRAEAEKLISLDGKKLIDIFKEKNYSLSPSKIKNINKFIEIHIEQGRVLESKNLKIGMVNVIAGNYRMNIKIKGQAEHSGATPMSIRMDSLAASAELILEVERIAKNETATSVGTVGFIKNSPNAMNVIPGETSFSVDFRDINTESMVSMKNKFLQKLEKVCQIRDLEYELIDYPLYPATSLSEKVVRNFQSSADSLKISNTIMKSGAGHDCMMFEELAEIGLVFIPCKDGISHNPDEEIDYADASLGLNLLIEYFRREHNVN